MLTIGKYIPHGQGVLPHTVAWMVSFLYDQRLPSGATVLHGAWNNTPRILGQNGRYQYPYSIATSANGSLHQ